MSLISRILGIGSGHQAALVNTSADNHAPERRSRPTSWDLLQADRWPSESGSPVSPYLAENLSAVFGCVQIISETIGTLPPIVYRKTDGVKVATPNHPVGRLFSIAPNTLQTTPEFLEMMTAHVLLRGNAYAQIIRDDRGAPVELLPMHPDQVCVMRIPNTRKVVYDVTDVFSGRTFRLLAEEILHIKDRSEDAIVGRSRLHRCRETFGTAISTERFAANTYRNSATMSGVLIHPERVGDEALRNIKTSFDANHSGVEHAKSTLVLEEGLKWQSISVSPEDAQMLESRRFSVEQIARLFRVPPPVLGDLSHGTYSNVTELGRWFYQHTIMPWLTKWERTLERALFSEEGRRTHEIEFDVDMLVRGDMLQRFQAYRIGREVGLYSANDLRKFENLNPRTDADADAFLSPMNMQSEQKGEPKRDAAA